MNFVYKYIQIVMNGLFDDELLSKLYFMTCN